VYPVATFAPEGESLESIEQFATAAPLSAAALEWFGMYYLPDMSAAMDPYASPLLAEDLSGLPPATVIQAQIDPLQSQGTVYAEALEAAGVPVTRSLYEGVTHEFFGMGQVVDKAAEAVEEAAAALRSSFGM
jgi:acetyl esterase/lipase